MPPLKKAGGSAFEKDVEFVTKDTDEQVAAGIVMVPDKADLQQDFAREATIREFAEQFETFTEAGEAGGGVMHAAWPDEWMTLERNEVLDESETIGGETVDAGVWVQEWAFNHDDLWGLVDDGILEGYSIGAINVDWDGPFDPDADDAVADVAVPDQLPDDVMIWELTDGLIREVSAVDVPAVPDAQILEAKADDEAAKRLAEHLGDREAFIEEAQERGHSEAEAERLWDVLNEATSADGADDPGKASPLARAGKAFLSALTPGSATESDDDDTTSEASDGTATRTADATAADTAKAGRTLSKENRDSLMASIDAGLDVLHDAGVDTPKRFTDRDDVDFSLTEHEARERSVGDDDASEDGGPEDSEDDDAITPDSDHGDGSDDEADAAASTDDDATGGDTPDSTDMSDNSPDDDPLADAPEWAKALHEQTEANAERIDELAGDGQKDAAADGDGDDPLADAPEWAKALHEKTEQNAERIDAISKQSGYSDQVDASTAGDGDTDDSGLSEIGKALS